jgi:hypothetical protein
MNENSQVEIDMFIELLEKIAVVCGNEENFLEKDSNCSPRSISGIDMQELAFRSSADFTQASSYSQVPLSRRTCENFEVDSASISRKGSVFSSPAAFDRNSFNERDLQVIDKLKLENYKMMESLERIKKELDEKNERIFQLEEKNRRLDEENQRVRKELEEFRSGREGKNWRGYEHGSQGIKEKKDARVSLEFPLNNEEKSQNKQFKDIDLDFSFKTGDKGKREDKVKDLSYSFNTETTTKGNHEENSLSLEPNYGFTFGKNQEVSKEMTLEEVKNSKKPEKNPPEAPVKIIEKNFDSHEPSGKIIEKVTLNSKSSNSKSIQPLPSAPDLLFPIQTPEADASSSDEEEKPTQILIPDPYLQYRIGNCMMMGVLFENDQIHISFQLKVQNSDILCILLLGNKSSEAISEITTELEDVSMSSFPIIMQPIKTNEKLVQGSQSSRMLKAQFLSPVSKIPKLKVTFKSTLNYSLSLLLPITIGRLCKGQKVPPAEIWGEWRKLSFEEASFNVNLLPFNSHMEICSFLTLGNGFGMYSKQEINELGVSEYLGATKFEEVLVIFTINVSPSGNDSKMRIRSRNNLVRDTLAMILITQVSSVPLI